MSMLLDTQSPVEVLASFAQIAAVIVGGAWVLWLFQSRREGKPSAELDVSMEVLGPYDAGVLVELTATVENKSKVRHWLASFNFDLRGLRSGGTLVVGSQWINHQALFDQALIEARPWVPAGWKKEFIDPGVRQCYRYVTAVDRDMEYLFLYSRLVYGAGDSRAAGTPLERLSAPSQPEFLWAQKVIALRGRSEPRQAG